MTLHLTPGELAIIDRSLFDCNEQEKFERKRVLNKIQQYEEKMNYYLKKTKKIKKTINYVEKILQAKDKGGYFSPITLKNKYNESRKLGILLINHGKLKQGLDYLQRAINFKEEYVDSDNHTLLQDYYLLDSMKEKVSKILKK